MIRKSPRQHLCRKKAETASCAVSAFNVIHAFMFLFSVLGSSALLGYEKICAEKSRLLLGCVLQQSS
jgi:hypothetical protein